VVAAGALVPEGQTAECVEMPVRWPEIYHHLVDSVWPDGKARETSSLTVFAEDGLFKVCLNNKAEGFVCFMSGPGFYAVLDALQESLADGSVDWRKSRAAPKRK